MYFLALGELLPLAVQRVLVHVADCHDVAEMSGVVGIAVPFAANADTREINGVVGFFALRPAAACDPDSHAGKCGRANKVASAALFTHDAILLV